MGSFPVGFSGTPTLVQPSSGPTTPGFTGLSNYSQDLQNELNREVALASLPMQEMQNQLTTLTSQATELSTLNGDFQALQSAIANLASANQGILSATVSDPSVLSASLGAGALAGVYTVQVTSPGTYSNAVSTSGLSTVTDPSTQNISSDTSFVLTVNGVATTFSPVTSLNGLVAAINANPGTGVQATVVNLGSASTPDYRLSLQSTSLGPVTLQLNSVSAGNVVSPDLLNSTAGTPAQYLVNGQAAAPSDSSTVTVSPGVTATLTGAGTSTITVAPGTTSVSNALSSFATAFNNLVDELNKNIGQNGGALAGQSIVYSLEQSLSNLGNYTSAAGSLTSLADLGLTFDTTGHLNFDPTVLAGATPSQIASVESLLGSPTTGGFLQFATNLVASIEDPTTGTLANQISLVNNSITQENQQIAAQQTQITLLQTNLQNQISAADSSIASLESQLSYFTSLFQSMILPSPQQLATL